MNSTGVRLSPPPLYLKEQDCIKKHIMKELLFSVTAADCDWDYYRGSGAGGQKKNKTANCVRCTHRESGAAATSEDGRSQAHNKKNAFGKMARSDIFQKWLKLESARRNGEDLQVKEEVKRSMLANNIVVEGKENGRWTKLTK
jgi:protein subunit release factor B